MPTAWSTAFRYDQVAEQLTRHVTDIEAALEQLLRLMLFNACIHNIDDHERNFSLINRDGQFALAPAYDMVPSLTTGEYHAAGFKYSLNPPLPSEVASHGKIFGLPKTRIAAIAEQVATAVSRWEHFADQAGVNDRDMGRIAQVLRC